MPGSWHALNLAAQSNGHGAHSWLSLLLKPTSWVDGTIQVMFMLLLQAAQQAPTLARQVGQNLYVTIQPPPAGMPEWLKILITALVGFAVGTVSGISMEFLKPKIARRELRKGVSEQLDDELMLNLNAMESGKRILTDAKDKPEEKHRLALVYVMWIAGQSIKRDRYDFYLAEEKAVVYQIDEKKFLAGFYGLVNKDLLDLARKQNFAELLIRFGTASTMGRWYLQERKLELRPDWTLIEDAYMQAEGNPKGTIKPPDEAAPVAD